MMLIRNFQWSTGLRVDIEVGGEEKEYFLKASSSASRDQIQDSTDECCVDH